VLEMLFSVINQSFAGVLASLRAVMSSERVHCCQHLKSPTVLLGA